METDMTAHLTTGAVIVYLIEALKRWPAFRWLTVSSTTLTRLLSVTGLTLAGATTAGWEWLKQFCVQQLLYDGVIQKAGGGTP